MAHHDVVIAMQMPVAVSTNPKGDTGADQQRRYRARQRNGQTVTPTVMVTDHEGNGAADLFEGARAD
jgi:hypothetical protein